MIRLYGPELAESGYWICAIAPGEKRPLGNAWGEHPLTADECRNYKVADAGVGIICGKGAIPVYGLDFDIPGDIAFAEEMRQIVTDRLGGEGELKLQYRVGQPPKFLVPVRGAPGLRKQMSAIVAKGTFRARFEMLGLGQQFVAEGIHPKTRDPYQWFGTPFFGGDHLSGACALPTVKPEDIQFFISEFERLADKHGWAKDARPKGRAFEPVYDDADLDAALTPQYPLGLSIEQAKTYVLGVKGAEDYDTWLKMGMALHHEFSQTENADKALALWADWSMQAANFKSFEDLEYRWRGFGRQENGHAATMRWVVGEYKRTHYNKATELTEAGRAYRMAEYFGGELKYATDTDTWYEWDGVHWRPLSQASIETKAAYVLGDLLREDINATTQDRESRGALFKFYDKCQSAARVRGVVQYARTITTLWCESKDFDANPRYFGVANGDIDLETGELLPPDPRRMVSLASQVAYDPEAKCPLWEQTVREVLMDSEESAEYLQRIFGYAMCGDPKEEVMFIFHGSGNNGKSTILKVARSIFGPNGCSLSPETLTSTGAGNSASAGSARADLIALQGKRFAVIPETEERARLKEATVKRLVSIDEIAARGVYETKMRYFSPTWVPIMATNYLPRIDGTDEGIWRRVRPIGFNRNFDTDPKIKRDRNRSSRLRAELPGILSWFVKGAIRYQEEGLRAPKSVLRETADYRDSMDALQEWLDERCVFDINASVGVNDAWASWKRYSESAGTERAIPTKMALTQRLYKKGIESKQVRLDGRSSRRYIGLRLIDEFA